MDAYIRAVISDLEHTECADNSLVCVTGRLELAADADQAARSGGCQFLASEARKACETRSFALMTLIDARASRLLEVTLDGVGWPNSNDWSPQTEENAWLLAQHADKQPSLQKRSLDLLIKSTNDGKSPRRFAAYLIDRLARAEARPQVYGTQGVCQIDGNAGPTWRADPVEAPDMLDRRRAVAGLEPMAAYAARASVVCRGF